MDTLDVSFVGLGYIGLPTAVTMANAGLNVTGVDINSENVDRINKGEVTIVEPGLEEMLHQALKSGNFRATTEQFSADVYVIAVPTPFEEDYSVDIKFIFSAAESIAPHLSGGELIILESTSPPLTTKRLSDKIKELRPDLTVDRETADEETEEAVHFAYCPERILPGNAMEELRTNDRIIGGFTPTATRLATEVYRTFCEGQLLPTNARTAELAKLAENSFRDVNIAFANELSLISDRLDIDVWELIELANHHPRVNILQPGPGVGGHCIAVDPWFIVSSAPEQSRLIRTAREINDGKPEWVLEKVAGLVTNSDVTSIAALGLSFKADIDDLRESPALAITEKMAKIFTDTEILVVEPNIEQLPEDLNSYNNTTLVELEDALERAELLVLLVDHKEFRQLPAEALQGKLLLDTKGIWRAPQS